MFQDDRAQPQLRNDELMHIYPNPSTSTSLGHGLVAVNFNTISRIFGVGEFAWNVVSNARSHIRFDVGIATTDALE